MQKAALGRLFLCSYDLYNLPKIPFRWLLLARLYSLKSKEIYCFFYDRSPGVLETMRTKKAVFTTAFCST